MNNIFPFTIGLPHDMIAVFREHDDDTWYEADVVVTSKTSATFRVYGMFDNVWGGRGRHLRDVVVKKRRQRATCEAHQGASP